MDLQDIFDDYVLEEEEEMNEIQAARKQRVVKERPNHFENWNDTEFVRRFRITKSTTEHLLSIIQHKIKHNTDRNQAIPPMLQLLICLRFYATGAFYITIGDFANLHKSTICNIIKNVTEAIASTRPQFIRLPKNDEIRKTQEEFHAIARFPRVIGALDGTHIRIMSPGGNTAENFRNRKGYFSLNVQAICNAKLQIQDIVARWPGSTHDSMIFLNSAAKYHISNGSFGNGLILGDSGYFCNNYLLTPCMDPQSPAQHLYNESHIRTRNVIERCFGVWKRRFPVLSIGMRCKLPLVQDIIIETAIIHNLATEMNETEPPIDPEVNIPSESQLPDTESATASSSETRNILLEYFESLIN